MMAKCRRASCMHRPTLLAMFLFVVVVLVLLRPDALYWHRLLPRNETRIVTSEYMGTGQMGNSMFEYIGTYVLARRQGLRFIVLAWGAQFKAYSQMRLLFNLTAPCRLELSIFPDKTLNEKGWGIYSPELEQPDLFGRHTRIYGWLQSWRYLAGHEQFVRDEFALTDYYRDFVARFFETHGVPLHRLTLSGDMRTTLVAVHVRRGDMLLFPEKYRMASMNYVIRAMSHFYDKYFSLNGSRLVFVVATDDLTWTQAMLNTYWNDRGQTSSILYTRGTAEEDMAILSSCHHAVITGGSYGWWAAWLTGGEVVYFRDFIWNGSIEYQNYNAYDYYPPSWIGLT